MGIFDFFNEAYEIRALLAACLVGLTCGLLGCFVVLRNMALVGDALSHAVLPGVVAGYALAGYNVLAFFSGSVVAGFATAVMITWLQRNVRTRPDAAIGIVFTVMFAIGVMGISAINRRGVHLDLKDFLFGIILGVSDQDLALTGIVAAFVVICIILFFRYFFITAFQPGISKMLGIKTGVMHYFLMLLLSFAIVASMRSVGVILVVAMLIIPASTAYLLTNRLNIMLAWSAGFGVSSGVFGLIAAIQLDVPPGPAMTVMSAIIYGFVMLTAPEKGVIPRWLRRRHKKLRILGEDILKRMAQTQQVASAVQGDFPVLNFSIALRRLRKNGYVRRHAGEHEITESGKRLAWQLVRAHRLWETYMVEKMGVDNDQIHEAAERLEHLIPPEMLNRLDEGLGFPQLDPHGSAIPRPKAEGPRMLREMEEGSQFVISVYQPTETALRRLWDEGLTPNVTGVVQSIGDEQYELRIGERVVHLERPFGDLIQVNPISQVRL